METTEPMKSVEELEILIVNICNACYDFDKALTPEDRVEFDDEKEKAKQELREYVHSYTASREREVREVILPKVQKFIDKVETGRARSKETYADMLEIRSFLTTADVKPTGYFAEDVTTE